MIPTQEHWICTKPAQLFCALVTKEGSGPFQGPATRVCDGGLRQSSVTAGVRAQQTGFGATGIILIHLTYVSAYVCSLIGSVVHYVKVSSYMCIRIYTCICMYVCIHTYVYSHMCICFSIHTYMVTYL